MNATNLYVSTCRLILQANSEDSSSWTDLYRLLPYLRQSLSCTVCGNLLIEPHTPTETNCQHHVCKSCKGGKKKLKPSCSWCKDYDKYIENVQLRILLQCYKKLCEYITSTSIFKKLGNTNVPTNNINTNLLDGTTPTLINLIQEGSGFADEFRSSASVRPSNYIGLLPCINTNTTSTQTNLASASVFLSEDLSTVSPSDGERDLSESSKSVQNGSSMYSVLYAGSGNKLTIKRKATDTVSESIDSSPQVQINTPLQTTKNTSNQSQPTTNTTPSKKGTRGGKTGLVAAIVKTGCRCGNATAYPGKLTCCGQRCACYTDSKPCVDCKCRGCRNPHTADGLKVCPVYQVPIPGNDGRPQVQCESPDSNSLATVSGGTVQVVGVYTMQLKKNSSATPILLDANTTVTTCASEDFDGDIEGHI